MPGEIFASVITIGDELLIGQTIDTNSAYIGKELNKIGIWLKRRVAVGDVYDDIWNALNEEARQSDIIIITGGLGPTADDITKPLLCHYFGAKMVVNLEVLQHIEDLFTSIYRKPGPLLERNKKQAEVPDTCTVLPNANGTAPGMWFEKESTIFISLPGVPHEMRALLQQQVIPRLKEKFLLPAIVHAHAYTAGIGESSLAEKLSLFESALPAHIKLAYLPSYGMVKLRLTARGAIANDLQKELTGYHAEMLSVIKDVLVSDTNDAMEMVVGKILTTQNKTLATAESCTGGYIAHLITSVAGSSNYFMGSVVAYANSIKQNILQVPEQTLNTHGAVSEETIKEMIRGVLHRFNSDYAIATSGIMGPGGGTAQKPVGTVWIAAGSENKTITKLLHLRFDRERNIQITAVNALNLLRTLMLEEAANE